MNERDPYQGKVLNGTYRVLRPISRGGMGLVYEAENVRLRNVRYAIKVLLQKWVEDREHLEVNYARFRREAEIASALKHPNIVSIVDYNKTEEGYPYLVMELLEGEDLDLRLKREGTLPPDEVCTILGQVGSALQLAHHCGIVHRDLKPGNIFLCAGPTAKLLDFGISKEVETRTKVTLQEVVIIGTPAYMSPEQARGEIEAVDHTSDIFALATIAYRCLTGERAFDGRSDSDIRYQVCFHEPPTVNTLVPGAPAALQQVFRRAHAKKKEQRYQLVSEMVRDFLLAFGREPPPSLDPLDMAKTLPIDAGVLAQVRALQIQAGDLSITQAPERTRPTVDGRPGERMPTPAPRAETTAPTQRRSIVWAIATAIALVAAAMFVATLLVTGRGGGTAAATGSASTPDQRPAAFATPLRIDAATPQADHRRPDAAVRAPEPAPDAAAPPRPTHRPAAKTGRPHHKHLTRPLARPPERPEKKPAKPEKKPGKKPLVYDDV